MLNFQILMTSRFTWRTHRIRRGGRGTLSRTSSRVSLSKLIVCAEAGAKSSRGERIGLLQLPTSAAAKVKRNRIFEGARGRGHCVESVPMGLRTNGAKLSLIKITDCPPNALADRHLRLSSRHRFSVSVPRRRNRREGPGEGETQRGRRDRLDKGRKVR